MSFEAGGAPGDDLDIAAGDLVNIDVSAELDGFFADNGASFAVPPTSKRIESLCRVGRSMAAAANSSR